VATQPGEQVAAACQRLFGSPADYEEPVGYDGLALAIIDAVWSIGVRYGGVGHVLNNYRAWVVATYDTSAEERSGPELSGDIARVGGPEAFASTVVHNHQRTSSRGGMLKAAAVDQAARALAAEGVTTTAELREHAESLAVKAAWRGVHGQSSGISWHYVLMNARFDDVKADRMICAFVARALGQPKVLAAVAYDEVIAAHQQLKAIAPGLTLKALDHRIWSYQRAR